MADFPIPSIGATHSWYIVFCQIANRVEFPLRFVKRAAVHLGTTADFDRMGFKVPKTPVGTEELLSCGGAARRRIETIMIPRRLAQSPHACRLKNCVFCCGGCRK